MTIPALGVDRDRSEAGADDATPHCLPDPRTSIAVADEPGQRVRIALLTSEYVPYPGGVATYCREMALAAQQLGHDVTVLAPDYGQADHGPDGGIAVVRYPGGAFAVWPHRLLQLVRHVRRLLQAKAFDVVHAADWPMVLALAFIRRNGEQRVVTIHGTDVLGLFFAKRRRLMGSRRAMLQFDRYVPNSRFSAGLLATHFPRVARDRIVPAPLGVGQHWLSPDCDQPGIARGSGPFTLLTVARIEARKGHLAMVEAIAMLPRDLGPVRYVCIGRKVDDALFQTIERRACALGVDFVCLGVVSHEDLIEHYRRADVFALAAQACPRTVEGFGLVLLEAASQGLPALVTPVDAIPEVVVDGETGWVTRSAAPGDIAACLAGIIAQRDAIGQKADLCIAHARKFGWTETARITYGLSRTT